MTPALKYQALCAVELAVIATCLFTLGKFGRAAIKPYPRAYIRAYRTDQRVRDVEIKETT